MSVKAKRFDVEEFIERDELVVRFSVVDLADAVVNITGGTVHWGLADAASDETFLVEKTGAGQAEVFDGPTGLIDVTFVADDTAGLDGVYHHRCKLTLAGKTETVAWGAFVVSPTPE